MALAEMAEPLGFDSVWSVEHHFTDYTMCPDPTMFLSHMAGHSKQSSWVRWLWFCPGTIRCALPSTSPCWTTCPVAVSSLGIGRGAGKVEFDGFRLDMGESRERFVEAAEMVLEGLESGHLEYDGKHYKQPKVDSPEPVQELPGAAPTPPPSAPEIGTHHGETGGAS